MSRKPPKLISTRDKTLEQQLNYLFNDIYRSLGAVETKVQTQSKKVESLEWQVSTRNLRYDPITVTPSVYANIGEAVHRDKDTNTLYRADCYLRNNVIGVIDGRGNLVTSGVARNVGNLTEGSNYYLYTTSTTKSVTGSGTTTYPIRYDASTYSQSQSFTNMGGRALLGVTGYFTVTGSPNYNLYFELRSNNAVSGTPDAVLTRSEYIHPDNVKTAENLTLLFNPPILIPDGLTYHLCLQADTTSTSTTDYVSIGGYTTTSYGYRCYSNSSDVWTKSTLTNLGPMTLLFTSVLSPGTECNISSSLAPTSTLRIFRPYIVGKAMNSTDLFVDIIPLPYVLYTDTGTILTATSPTPKDFFVANITNPYNCTKAFVTLKLMTNTKDKYAYAQVLLAGQLDSTVLKSAALSWATSSVQSSTIFTLSNNYPFTLYIRLSTEGTLSKGYASYFTVYGLP